MIVLVDNYDSFTYNLVHYLAELGAEVKVIRNDAMTTAELLNLKPEGIVISPGPKEPAQAGICLEVIRNAGNIPVLGVCLGHQAIGQAFGGKVVRGDKPVHGKTSAVYHQGKGLFAGLKSPFNAARYHSLILERDTLPMELEITAETADGVIMAVSARNSNIHGVQFHPESIASELGHDILKNFLQLTATQ